MIDIDDFTGDSLAEFAKWIARVVELHPDAKVWTYEHPSIFAGYDAVENRVETS